MSIQSLLHRLLPLLLLSVVWLCITKGSTSSWIVGVPSIFFAFFVFDRLRKPQTLSMHIWLLPEFIGWFLWQSLRGGTDVAWRTLQIKMPLQPGFIDYPFNLPPGLTRVFMTNCVSLLPGTLSADIEGDQLLLHVLDTRTDIIAETKQVELRVQRLYGLQQKTSEATETEG